MSHYPKIRLFVEQPLAAGLQLQLEGPQTHYLAQVMRVKAGGHVALFNGKDGEWFACIDNVAKKKVDVTLQEQLRAQHACPDITLCFAPIKQRVEYIVEKATELGVRTLQPVITARTIVDKVNREKLQMHAVEAAEQSERLDVPEIKEPLAFDKFVAGWGKGILLYADETGGGLQAHDLLPTLAGDSYGIVIGPEGGFTPQEIAVLQQQKFAHALSLGPRVLRADTAAFAALTLLQEFKGDWQGRPAFRGSAHG